MWQALLEAATPSPICPRVAGRSSWTSRGWPSGSPRPAPEADISKDLKGFDAEFFALSKMEADNMDPQQRLALELTWEALENARIPASSLRGGSVGVYIGSSTNDYSYLAMMDPRTAHPYAITGTASSIIANRCPTSTTSAVPRWPSTPPAPARWWPCTSGCRRCAPVRPTWWWPAASTPW